jgi:uncharacterized protein YndB with AHSA1/START domain/uncharacterized protein YciI
MSKLAATAVADLEQGVVLARVDIAVPPERVFEALTTDELTQWWGSPEMYRTTKHSIALRPGGAWKSEGIGADGSEFHVGGEVIEVDPPHKLVYTWKPSWEEGPPTTVSYRLEAIPTGTRVTVRHSGFTNPQACSGHAEGWERVFGWLGAHLAAKQVFFLARLIPPRPSFPGDMTPEEAEVMKAHAAYCRTLIANGTGLVFGPVADPKGVWGAGVLKVADAAAARAIADADPVIKAGKGFAWELVPMLNAMY